MASSNSTQQRQAQANVDNFFQNGGNNNNNQDLVFNPATGTFDVAGSSSMPNQVDVMVSTTKDGHFASNMSELVFDPNTGGFAPAASAAAAAPATFSGGGGAAAVEAPSLGDTPVAVPVTPQAAEPAQMMVMKSVAKDGHFADVARLQMEAAALNSTFPNQRKSLSRTQATVQYKGRYNVIVEIPENYPHDIPKCFLEDTSLRFKDGTLVTQKGASHEYHLLGTANGRAQICHGRRWNAAGSLASVFVKAFMWIEAYENHLKSGRPLNSYLKTQAE